MTSTEQLPAATPAVDKPKPKPNPNALLLLFRKYHTWAGVFAAGFVVMIAVTGIYLNHKDTFRSILGGPTKDDEVKGPGGKPGLPGSSELTALPVSMPQAVELAGPHLAGRPVEKVELRPEHGRLVYKVKAVEGPEAVIDAHTGAAEIKGEKMESKPTPPRGEKGEKGGKAAKPKKEAASGEDVVASSTSSPQTKGIDWGKAIKDLHTGKIGGDAGKLLIDFVAVILIVLTLTGLYLWIVPVLRKRRSARQRAVAAAQGAA